jgi:hypothetical protein
VCELCKEWSASVHPRHIPGNDGFHKRVCDRKKSECVPGGMGPRCKLSAAVGSVVGPMVGLDLDTGGGAPIRDALGAGVGNGKRVGSAVGFAVGNRVGPDVGPSVGCRDGERVGHAEGRSVGLCVGQ